MHQVRVHCTPDSQSAMHFVRGLYMPLGIKSMSDWPFDDPENVMTISMKQIVREGESILLVVRDEEDGTWQFLTGGPFHVAAGMMVTLKNMLTVDSTLRELADLPTGWQATREAKGQPWVRTQSEPVESDQ